MGRGLGVAIFVLTYMSFCLAFQHPGTVLDIGDIMENETKS